RLGRPHQRDRLRDRPAAAAGQPAGDRSSAGPRAAARSRGRAAVMELGALAAGLEVDAIEGEPRVDVRGIAIDSRAVAPGDLFFALAGQRTDGRRHVAEAIARGACAVVAEGDVQAPGAALVRTRVARRLLGHMAARLAGDPTAQLTLVGVTGTNGKTTTTYLLE